MKTLLRPLPVLFILIAVITSVIYPAVATVRGLPLDQVSALVAGNTAGRRLGIFGEARVNMLKLNLALDDIKPMR